MPALPPSDLPNGMRSGRGDYQTPPKACGIGFCLRTPLRGSIFWSF